MYIHIFNVLCFLTLLRAGNGKGGAVGEAAVSGALSAQCSRQLPAGAAAVTTEGSLVSGWTKRRPERHCHTLQGRKVGHSMSKCMGNVYTFYDYLNGDVIV